LAFLIAAGKSLICSAITCLQFPDRVFGDYVVNGIRSDKIRTYSSQIQP
jgi:hypothetical protein